MMRRVKSCGVLVFRREPELAFLLMRHRDRVDLPKGHLKEGESELDCALRELTEETGLSKEDILLEDGFRFVHTYYPIYKRFGGERVEKAVVFFLAWLGGDSTISVTEHVDFEWVTWPSPEFGHSTIDGIVEEVRRWFEAHPPVA